MKELFRGVSIPALSFLAGFNDRVRNMEIGHPGALQEDQYYQELLREYAPQLEALNSILWQWRRLRLLVSESTTIEVDGFNYAIRLLHGETIPFSRGSWRSNERLFGGQVYALTSSNAPLCLHPLVRYEFCHECQRSLVFLLHGSCGPSAGTRYVSTCPHPLHDRTTSFKMIID
jgi:hypothetical protein